LGATYGSQETCCGTSVVSSITNTQSNYVTNALVVAPSSTTQVALTLTPPASSTVDVFEVTNSSQTKQVYIDKSFKTTFVASSTTTASINIPSGGTPTTPVIGDLWSDGELKFWNGSFVESITTGNSDLAMYADGSDGSVTFDGAATVLGMAPSSNVYTM